MFCSFQAKKETPAREKEKAGACPQKSGESPKDDRKNNMPMMHLHLSKKIGHGKEPGAGQAEVLI